MSRVGRIRLGLVMIDSPQWTGGGIYLRNLVYALASLPCGEKPEAVLVGVSDPKSPLVEELCSLEFVRILRPGPAGGPRDPMSWLARLRRLFLGWNGSPGGTESNGLVDVLYPAGFGVGVPGAVEVFWIADFQHMHLPNFFSNEEIETRQRGMAAIARQRGVLVLSSQSALDDFRTLFPDALIRPRVWSFCSSFGLAEEGGVDPRDGYSLPEKFLYLPNQFWAHKDHLVVFKALLRVRKKGVAPTLVCTGLEEDYRNPGHFKALMEYVKQERLDPQVRFLGLVPRRDQIQIFRYAAAVVQPSLFEGWSTVVEDAKSLGRPLILSDIPPHREQVTGSFRFFAAGSDEHLASVLEEVWPELSPGPDAVAERAALARTARRRVELGRAFMTILDEAVALGHSG